MYESGQSIRQIAKYFNKSYSGTRAVLIRHGIALRTPHLPHGNNSQLKFGQKRTHGTIKIHKKEYELILKIKKLKKQNYSLRKICEYLNHKKISTKQKSTQWQPEMIRRILQE